MIDRAVEFPNRYKIIQVPGQPGVFDLTPVPGDIAETGTPISKGTLLKDATYDMYKLSEREDYPTDRLVLPDDIFKLLASPYLTSLVTVLSGGQLRSNQYNVGTGSGNSLFSNIDLDMSGKCTKNINGQYCDRVYFPKGATKALVYIKARGRYYVSISIRINGIDTVVFPTSILSTNNQDRFFFGFVTVPLSAPSDGSDYLSVYLDVTSHSSTGYTNSLTCDTLVTAFFNDQGGG